MLAAVARRILGGELMYIILDGHFTSMCWFHADMEACTLVSIASTLMLIVPGSFLLLDVLGGVTSNCVLSTRPVVLFTQGDLFQE